MQMHTTGLLDADMFLRHLHRDGSHTIYMNTYVLQEKCGMMGNFISKIKLDTVRYSFRIQAFRHDVKYKICATLIHCKNSQTATPVPHGHQGDLQSHLSDHRKVLPIKLNHSLTLLFASIAGSQPC